MKDPRAHWFVVLLALALGFSACRRGPTPAVAAQLTAQLRQALDAKAPSFVAADGDRGHHAWQEEQRFYKQAGYRLMWTDGKHPRAQMDALVRAVRAADQEGLDPGDYRIDELDAIRRAPIDDKNAVDADLRSTYAYLRYAADLVHGRIDPEDIDSHWHAVPRNVDLHGTLESALEEGTIEASLQRLAPASPQYQGLKHQLAIARAAGNRAVIDPIAMNMERWRWLPEDLGPRYILVNIPAFRLDAIEDGKSVLDMKVVTGKKSSPTPVLSDKMTTVVFSPYWNIPSDIVSKEIMPKIAKDPDYLAKNNMEIAPDGHSYRQRPGPGNSLGGVKFLFPNHFNVYLHDTPSQSLFERIERDFSHGCVRLDDPDVLAKYVLRDQPEWTDEKIKEAMHIGVERSVALKQPLPIYLVYFTVWEANGQLQRVDDVYGLDRRRAAASGG